MKNELETKELQNQSQIDDFLRLGPAKMGPWTSHIWRSDPRHLGFLLARYKFVSKMFTGKNKVLEVGCGDAVGTPVVLQTVDSIHGIDFEPLVLNDAIKRYSNEGVKRASFSVHDMLSGGLSETFDAAFSLDVIEHIPETSEDLFMKNIVSSLSDQAVVIIGTPNITAKDYASPASVAGHINLKSADTLKSLLLKKFHNVFIFSMNDEIVHTGYSPMSHYLLAMGVGVKRDL
jgi:2-polyprenyl-3-methyl-5-hydroxy-6-metoxy-1,4-benzoquinol methylase